jgi:hypothetical protein
MDGGRTPSAASCTTLGFFLTQSSYAARRDIAFQKIIRKQVPESGPSTGIPMRPSLLLAVLLRPWSSAAYDCTYTDPQGNYYDLSPLQRQSPPRSNPLTREAQWCARVRCCASL